MPDIEHIHLDPTNRVPLLRYARSKEQASHLPVKNFKGHPQEPTSQEDAKIYFIGTATTVIEWGDFRILTDPNFLHAGDHVHLGPGVSATRRTNPALDIEELPAVDCVLLSHYHEDHFDKLVEDSLNRAFPIITTPHAMQCLTSPDQNKEPFTRVTSLDPFESSILHIDSHSGQNGQNRAVKVSGLPGKHVPPGLLSAANDFVQAVPPTNGWLVELGYQQGNIMEDEIGVGYRIYITGDTLYVDELKKIPEYLKNQRLDLMLVHLGGTTIPGPFMPLIMVTMDAKQGLQLMRLVDPDVTIPIHYDDYNVFLSPLSDFKDQVDKDGYEKRVVYLDRGDAYKFSVKDAPSAL
ncbi:hypothetical protein V2G26_002754 [Clonostachys chloroleuca]